MCECVYIYIYLCLYVFLYFTFQERQRRMVLWHAWPQPLSHILCDFALAEKNYYDTNFEPVRNKTAERKEDKVLA